jgi:hypothetical protein
VIRRLLFTLVAVLASVGLRSAAASPLTPASGALIYVLADERKTTMHRITHLVLSLVLVAAVAAGMIVVPHHAAAASMASGSFTTTTASLTNQRMAGSNTIFDLTFTGSWTGTFTGTVVGQGTVLFHADGSGQANTVDIFTGTVNGTPGTVTLNDVAKVDAGGAYRGTYSILSGTGALANLRGALHAVGIAPPCCPPTGTYTGTLATPGSL